ncbi:Transmembrane domain-containing protein [Giardia duodenalis]|uniref:Transmembrane domain-containing protein n=1 Tax=Giardia intestinalis (strain ATCC 50803 / WB clone C6) TaxID=184922 RepID=A8B2H5_GIAIC|nr:Transmembrane domain-containing protein [Giardia intestinalis]KAE8302979.1 Transmembrane domain-containing protein [Giardia intestinalis]|eukprot:XP_001709974.1 Hypothetical protein GL50803_20020 [Giardia lamblia ATCC 50803]
MCCDEDVIALICVGVPMVVYALIVGFQKRNPAAVGQALKTCFNDNKSIWKKDPLKCLAGTKYGGLFLFIMIVAVICIIYGIVVQILKCILCCCNCCCGCCGCLDCFLKYAFRIGVGVGYPSLMDFLTYLISASVAKNNNWVDNNLSKRGAFNNAVGGYSGISMLSLAAGWVFTVVIGSFFIQKDSCGLKFLGLILGCIVAFVIIAAVVPADPRNLYSGKAFNNQLFISKEARWGGVLLGFINVGVFTGMYAAALCCLNGCCCCK